MAENRTAFAASHDLRLWNGRVLVVIELDEDASLPEGFDLNVTGRVENDVQAYVRVDGLTTLAANKSVRMVRPPKEMEPQSIGFSHHDN